MFPSDVSIDKPVVSFFCSTCYDAVDSTGKRVLLESCEPDDSSPTGQEGGYHDTSSPVERVLRRRIGESLAQAGIAHQAAAEGATWALYSNPAHCTVSLDVHYPSDTRHILRFARSLVTGLARLHEARLFLGQPLEHHILWNPETDGVLLVGLDRALPVELGSFSEPTPREFDCSEATLGARPDERTDLFLAGTLLSGFLDRLEEPVGATAFRQVLQLMCASIPEERYQSASAALADLDELAAGLPPRLAAFRSVSRYRATRRLHGVDRQRAELASGLRRLHKPDPGTAVFITVEGPAKTGKSALCNETIREQIGEQSILLKGSFDPALAAVPLAAIIETLASYLRTALLSNEENRVLVQESLEQMSEEHHEALRSAIPELELFGHTPATESWRYSSRHKIADAVADFIARVSFHRPVCLFLDDCQWFDYPSLELLRKLATVNSCRLVVLLAFSDRGGVNPSFLSAMVADLGLRAVPLHRIRLGPLPLDACTSILSESTGIPAESIRGRISFLRPMYPAGIFLSEIGSVELRKQIVPTADRMGLEFAESIRIAGDEHSPIRDLREQVGSLPTLFREVMSAAALIGLRFDLSELVAILDVDADEIAGVLLDAVELQLIEPSEEGGTAGGRFRFNEESPGDLFDLEDDQRRAGNARLADHLEDVSDDYGSGSVYRVAEFAHRAWELTSSEARQEGRAVYRARQDRAGGAALEAGAYHAAIVFLERVCAADRRTNASSESLYRWIETLVAAGEISRAEELLSSIEAKPLNQLETARHLELEVRLRLKDLEIYDSDTGGLMSATYTEVRRFLGEKGIPLPRRSSRLRIAIGLIEAGLSGGRLRSQRTREAPQGLEAVLGRILVHSASLALFIDPALSLQVHLLIARYMRRRHPIVMSPLSFAFLGSLVAVQMGRPAVGRRYGDIAATMIDDPANHPYRGSTMFQLYGSVMPMTGRFRDFDLPLRETYFSCVESSDRTVAGLCHFTRLLHRLFAGDPARSILDELTDHPGSLIVSEDRFGATTVLHQAVANLAMGELEPWLLRGPIFDERSSAAERIGPLAPSVLSAFTAVAFGRYHTAWERLELSKSAIGSVASLPMTILIDFLLCFCAAVLGRPYSRRITHSLSRLRRAAEHSPGNFGHLSLIVDGELERRRHRPAAAREKLEQAAEAAEAASCLYCAAIAYERLASLLAAGGKETLSQVFTERRDGAIEAWRGGSGVAESAAAAEDADVRVAGLAAGEGSYVRSYLGGVDIDRAVASVRRALVDDELFAENGLRVTELADRIGLSAHQLSELFSRHIGQSFASYVNRWRVRYAAEQIKSESEKSLLEIAYESGFGSKTAFNVAFKQETGLTPSQYRGRVRA